MQSTLHFLCGPLSERNWFSILTLNLFQLVPKGLGIFDKIHFAYQLSAFFFSINPLHSIYWKTLQGFATSNYLQELVFSADFLQQSRRD